MGEVTIEGTVLMVTPIQSSQGRPMVQITLGDPLKGPVTMPLDMDREMAGVTIAVQRVLTQLPGVGQQLGTPRLIVTLTEEEYQEMGRPRYPDHITITLKVQT
ncbi:MAG: arcadin 1 [Candidatus Bathyarchaeia archaeon]